MFNRNYAAQAKELVSRMTLEEKTSQLRFDSAAIPRLGIPEYNWWNEGLHGVARAGTATMFPQAVGMAAIFDEDFIYRIADVISTEARAKYNMASSHGDRDIYKGLTFWSPNINIFRDPRWGRGQETYGEDPYLTARLGVAFIKGLQQPDEQGNLKVAACAKHFAVHSGPEAERHEFNAVVSQKDLWETYLPAFEAAVTEADVEAVMGAYNRTNGEPCCGSKTLLVDILRGKWGFQGHVVSDCWAICDFHEYHKVTQSPLESVALALKNGCDVNCGVMYQKIVLACEAGLIGEDVVTTAAERAIETRLKLGMLCENPVYSQIPYSAVESQEHLALAEEASARAMVLLKNDGLLPLDPAKLKSVAVIGPTADSREILRGNYCGSSSKYVTLLQGIQAALPDARVYYSEGCHLYKDKVENLARLGDRISEAVAAAENAELVFLCLGLDASIEGEQGDTGNSYESGDKPGLSFPAPQLDLMRAVLATGKPVVALISTGSAMDLREPDESGSCGAILHTWYPGAAGGKAAADLIFGKRCPSGKLPVTFYRSADDLPDFRDYAMKGRTYRYLEKDALYPFGYGLSYADISYHNLSAPESVADGEAVTLTVTARNNSDIACDCVTQVYVKVNGSAHAVPNHSLCAFFGAKLGPREEKIITFTIPPRSLQVVNDDGERVFDGDSYTVYAGSSQPDAVSVRRLGRAPLEAKIIRRV